MAIGKTKAQLLADLLENALSAAGKVPESSIKSLRGGRPQAEIAAKSGVGQAYLSQLEAGKRDLTPEMAMRLAPSLGVSGTELWTSEQISMLRRASLKGEISPHMLLEAILELAKSTPDSELGDSLMEALMAVLREALEKVDVEDVTARGSEESEDEELPISMKASRRVPTRDSLGRRINKPHGGA